MQVEDIKIILLKKKSLKYYCFNRKCDLSLCKKIQQNSVHDFFMHDVSHF